MPMCRLRALIKTLCRASKQPLPYGRGVVLSDKFRCAAPVLAIAFRCAASLAQTTIPANQSVDSKHRDIVTPAPAIVDERAMESLPHELPADLRDALAGIEDFRFDFDQPGFYRAVEHIRAGDVATNGNAIELREWRDLLERPRDFRGRVVRIHGVVGANRAWTLQSRAELGTLHQLELYRDSEPLALTLICTESVDDVPIGAEIEAAGVFVMIRNYHSSTNQVRPAALLVATGPKRITTAAPQRDERKGGTTSWLFAGAGGALVAVWLIHRANARASRTRIDTLTARKPASQSVAEEFREWAVSGEDSGRDD